MGPIPFPHTLRFFTGLGTVFVSAFKAPMAISVHTSEVKVPITGGLWKAGLTGGWKGGLGLFM